MKTTKLMLEGVAATAVAAILGVGAAHWGMTAATPLFATAGSAVAGNVLGDFTYRLVDQRSDWALERFAELLRRGELPLNHDLICAVRKSQIRAITGLARQVVAVLNLDALATDRTAQIEAYRLRRFLRAILRWARSAERQLETHRFEGIETEAVRLIAAEICSNYLDAPLSGGQADPTAPLWLEAGRLALRELRDTMIPDIPAPFEAVLENGRAFNGVTWADATGIFFAEELKTNTAVYRVVSLELLRRLSVESARHHQAAIAEQRAVTADLRLVSTTLLAEMESLNTTVGSLKHELAASRSARIRSGKGRRRRILTNRG